MCVLNNIIKKIYKRYKNEADIKKKSFIADKFKRSRHFSSIKKNTRKKDIDTRF